MRVCRAVEKKMVDGFIGAQAGQTEWGVHSANPVKESIEWGMPSPQLHKDTHLHSGQVVSGLQESWGGQLSIDLGHLPLLWGSGP